MSNATEEITELQKLIRQSTEADEKLGQKIQDQMTEHQIIVQDLIGTNEKTRSNLTAANKAIHDDYKAWRKETQSDFQDQITYGLSGFVQRNLFEGNGTFNESFRDAGRKGLPYFNLCCNGGTKTETIIDPYYTDEDHSHKPRYFKPEFRILEQTGLQGCCSNSILKINEINIHQPESKWSGIYNCIGIAKSPVFISFYLKVLENHNGLSLPGTGIGFRRLWIDNIEHTVDNSAAYIQDKEWHHIKIEAIYTGGHNPIYPFLKKEGYSSVTVQMAAYKIEQSKFYTPYSPI